MTNHIMSGLYTTEIVIEDQRKKLRTLADCINTDDCFFIKILLNLGLSEDDCFFSYFSKAEMKVVCGRPALYLSIMTFDDANENSWNSDELVFKKVSFQLHSIGSDEHWTNDKDGLYFPERYFVSVINDSQENIGDGFLCEREAVRFVKKNCVRIPAALSSLDSINDYCLRNRLDSLWAYYHILYKCKCPPLTCNIINCILEVLDKI